MLRMFRTSILAKLLGTLIVSLALTLLITNLISSFLLGRSLDEQTLFNAEKVVGPNQAAVIQNLMPTGNTPLIQQTLDKMTNDSIPEITVYRQDGQASFASDPAKAHTVNHDAALLAILAQKEPQIRWYQEKGQRYLMSYSPVVANDQCASCHPGIKPGDVKGFIATKFSLKQVDALLVKQSLLNTAFSALLFVALLALLAWMLMRIVTRPLGSMTRAVEAIASGALDQHVPASGEDEMGRMAASLQRMVDSLIGVVRRVRHSANTVDSSVGQISSSTEQMAQTSRSQAVVVVDATTNVEAMAESIEAVAGNAADLAGNVSHTSQAIEQMVASIREVARNGETLSQVVGTTTSTIAEMVGSIQQVALAVDQTYQMAEQARSAAEVGQSAVQKTNTGMVRIDRTMREIVASIEELSTRSGQIGDILELIQDIADQTNLLALNAAIEAARAGEAGRGFAVVADEVRKLSERTAKATRAIGELVHAIQDETRQAITSTHEGNSAIMEGSTLAKQAGSALEAIVGAVSQTTQLMSQISTAAHEQQRSADQIVSAVERMRAVSDEVTHSTHDQANECEKVLRSVDQMSSSTQQVTNATSQQRVGARQMVELIESVNRAAQESSSATQLIVDSSSGLQSQATELQEAIAFFSTGEKTTVTAIVPPARHLSLPDR